MNLNDRENCAFQSFLKRNAFVACPRREQPRSHRWVVEQIRRLALGFSVAALRFHLRPQLRELRGRQLNDGFLSLFDAHGRKFRGTRLYQHPRPSREKVPM